MNWFENTDVCILRENHVLKVPMSVITHCQASPWHITKPHNNKTTIEYSIMPYNHLYNAWLSK